MDQPGNNKKQDLITKLTRTFDQLEVADLKLLQQMATALSRAGSLTSTCGGTDKVFSKAFCRIFGSQLLVQHLIFARPLEKKSFEYAFVNALQLSGKQVWINPNSSDSGPDVVVDRESPNPVRYSLKTESYNTPADKIRISKLMTAAATRKCNNDKDCIDVITNVVIPRLERADNLLILRYPKMNNKYSVRESSADNAQRIIYFLYEFPASLLQKVSSLKAGDFRQTKPLRGNVGEGWNAKVIEGGELLFEIGFTSGQVIIRNLSSSNGTLRGTWSISIR